MTENLDLCQILRDCPKGTKLWSPVWGKVTFETIDAFDGLVYVLTHKGVHITLDSDGKFDADGECIIFPSKDQRDWSKFKAPVKRFNPEEFKPFDKVLLCDKDIRAWIPGLFGSLLMDIDGKYAIVELGSRHRWEICIPYNDKTKQLAGTACDCPDYYKWWEE